MESKHTIRVRRQRRKNFMMKITPVGLVLFLPRSVKEDSPAVRAFIQRGLDTLGKRITDRLYVAYEQGLTIATNALRIEYALSRFFSVSAFAGTQSGIALNFRRSWR